MVTFCNATKFPVSTMATSPTGLNNSSEITVDVSTATRLYLDMVAIILVRIADANTIHTPPGDPFDVHLNLQTTSLVFGITGDPLPISVLYNATEAERGWQELASQRGVEIPDGEMTHGRKITRRINIDLVSDETKRKICRLLSLDYCCLNIELPEVCRGMNGGVDSVYCAMKTREVEDGSEDNENEEIRYIEKLVIEPWDEL
jgi:hypothetical protein